MAKKVFTLKELADMREDAINQGLALINTSGSQVRLTLQPNYRL